MSNKIYTTVPVPKFPRNVFSLSRPVVGSMRMQRLYPTEILEILPGDALNVRQECFVRTAPLVAPPLARVTVSHHAFFVPAWQLHQHFDDFITGGEDMDYTDKLPFTYVSDLYKWIDTLLSCLYFSLQDGDTFAAMDAYFTESPQILEDIISVIECLDYSRSAPFVLPEFLPMQVEGTAGLGHNPIFRLEDVTTSDFNESGVPDADVTALRAVLYSNWNAWRKYNPATLSTANLRVNLLPFYAQAKVWSEFFRDENLADDDWKAIKNAYFDSVTGYQNLSSSIDLSYDTAGWSNPDIVTDVVLDNWRKVLLLMRVRRRAWRKDRFTSALPWTQKGPDVTIPLAGSLPVSIDSSSVVPGGISTGFIGARTTSGKLALKGTDGTNISTTTLTGVGDLSNASDMATMRDLRRAEAVEEFAEADGRFGNRYPENTLGQFGVYTPDSRLPRCQFLGSTSQTVGFGEIPQTSETGDTPLGTLAGKGTSYNPGFLFKQRFTMHGFVVIFTSITVSALYEQGIHPMFSRYDRTEYAWPRYARLGEEPIYAKELCIDSVSEDTVFGYAPRYSTYKSDTGSVHGQMKSTLNYWTFSRKFESVPQLNSEFIYNEPRRDAFALTNPFTEQFYFELDWKVRASRLLPFFGVASI